MISSGSPSASVTSSAGPCQGRLCGLTVAAVIARERGVAVAEVGHQRVRPPIKPLTLGELAGLDGAPGAGASLDDLPIEPFRIDRLE